MNSIIYGPVSSWRLGRSLGIDLVSTKGKTCSFDCIYCQLGETVNRKSQRSEFVSLGQLERELVSAQGMSLDYVTFSGMGEPTLAANLRKAIVLVRSILHLPVAVLTNSSLISRPDVRLDLTWADVVVAKLDAPNEDLFCSINRPVKDISLKQTIDGISRFRKMHTRTLALQMMFMKANQNFAPEMAEMAAQLSANEIQLNTPLRHCPVKPLSNEGMEDIKAAFSGVAGKVVMVYDSPKSTVVPTDLSETLRRRPEC